MAKKYLVEVSRTSYCTFEVEANTAKEAEEKAEQEAYNMDWAREDADYRIGQARKARLP